MVTIRIKKKIHNPKWYQWLQPWKLRETFEVNIPRAWERVGKDDVIGLFAASLKKDESDRMYSCVQAILPSTVRDEAHKLSAIKLARIAAKMDFCEPRISSNEGWLFEDHKLLNNPPISSFRINDDICKLPGKDLGNITCRNFRDAVDAYGQVRNSNVAAAWEVIQALLIPVPPIEELKKLKYPIPSFILRYFSDCLEAINHNVKMISPTFFDESEGSGGSKVSFGWDGVFLEVAQDGVFGTYEQVLESKFHDVLIYSIKKYEDYLAQKAAIEKQQGYEEN